MSKKKKILAFVFLAAFSAIIIRVFFFQKDGPAAFLTLYGNVDQRQASPTFLLTERVAEILVEEGQRVFRGQPLAKLEINRLNDKIAVSKATVKQAEAALLKLRNGSRPEEIDEAKAVVKSAQANLDFAQKEFDRYSRLWKESPGRGVTQLDVDQKGLNLEVAQSNLEKAQKSLVLMEIGPRQEDIYAAEAVLEERKASLESLGTDLRESTLVSNLNGVISQRFLEPGDIASPQRAVFTILISEPKWVRVYVTEPELSLIKPGLEAEVFCDGCQNQSVKGVVGFIASESEFTPKTVQTESLRTSLVYEVRINVSDINDRLRLGAPVTVRLSLAQGG
ncbi:MAG: HlyD family efflux transporter periplasmic adaptor subunit [Deltaproteobacteria bacterium]|jgi:HlyD family secretion protein|nr:HlyD family efflux transporter periplasmic adaptor subunit [Deltaproteobacteria bacterium]